MKLNHVLMFCMAGIVSFQGAQAVISDISEEPIGPPKNLHMTIRVKNPPENFAGPTTLRFSAQTADQAIKTNYFPLIKLWDITNTKSPMLIGGIGREDPNKRGRFPIIDDYEVTGESVLFGISIEGYNDSKGHLLIEPVRMSKKEGEYFAPLPIKFSSINKEGKIDLKWNRIFRFNIENQVLSFSGGAVPEISSLPVRVSLFFKTTNCQSSNLRGAYTCSEVERLGEEPYLKDDGILKAVIESKGGIENTGELRESSYIQNDPSESLELRNVSIMEEYFKRVRKKYDINNFTSEDLTYFFRFFKLKNLISMPDHSKFMTKSW